MWWEWEGVCGEAAREETPVDFDFISLLSKPKVRRRKAAPTLLSPHFAARSRAERDRENRPVMCFECRSFRIEFPFPLSRSLNCSVLTAQLGFAGLLQDTGSRFRCVGGGDQV